MAYRYRLEDFWISDLANLTVFQHPLLTTFVTRIIGFVSSVAMDYEVRGKEFDVLNVVITPKTFRISPGFLYIVKDVLVEPCLKRDRCLDRLKKLCRKLDKLTQFVHRFVNKIFSNYEIELAIPPDVTHFATIWTEYAGKGRDGDTFYVVLYNWFNHDAPRFMSEVEPVVFEVLRRPDGDLQIVAIYTRVHYKVVKWVNCGSKVTIYFTELGHTPIVTGCMLEDIEGSTLEKFSRSIWLLLNRLTFRFRTWRRMRMREVATGLLPRSGEVVVSPFIPTSMIDPFESKIFPKTGFGDVAIPLVDLVEVGRRIRRELMISSALTRWRRASPRTLSYSSTPTTLASP